MSVSFSAKIYACEIATSAIKAKQNLQTWDL